MGGAVRFRPIQRGGGGGGGGCPLSADSTIGRGGGGGVDRVVHVTLMIKLVFLSLFPFSILLRHESHGQHRLGHGKDGYPFPP